jgi:hypothetical protein
MFGLPPDTDICLGKESALKQPPCGLASPLILAGQTLILSVPQVRGKLIQGHRKDFIYSKNYKCFYTANSYLRTYDLYGPLFLMRADPLRGQVGRGLCPGNREFLGPVKWHRADKLEVSRAQPPSTCPSN